MNAVISSLHSVRSTWVRRYFWVMVVIGMGILGVWSEVKAGHARARRILTRSLHVSVHPGGANAEMTLSEWPSGSVWIQGSAWTGNTLLIANDWKAPKGEIDVGAGVATAQGLATGTIWDFSAQGGPTSTPVSVDVAMRVEDTSTVWSIRGGYSQSGLVVLDTWDRPGERMARLDVAGNEDLTFDGGAMTLTVDGKSFVKGEGGLGQLKQNTTHTVEILK
jgi:hypothetical protein